MSRWGKMNRDEEAKWKRKVWAEWSCWDLQFFPIFIQHSTSSLKRDENDANEARQDEKKSFREHCNVRHAVIYGWMEHIKILIKNSLLIYWGVGWVCETGEKQVSEEKWKIDERVDHEKMKKKEGNDIYVLSSQFRRVYYFKPRDSIELHWIKT